MSNSRDLRIIVRHLYTNNYGNFIFILNLKSISLLFTNVTVTCNGNNNLQLIDSSANVLDYCVSQSSANSFSYSTISSQWVALVKKGIVSFTFSLNFLNICGNPPIKPDETGLKIVGGNQAIPNSIIQIIKYY